MSSLGCFLFSSFSIVVLWFVSFVEEIASVGESSIL